ncbi:DedA protein, partial [Pseudomonas savastanoi pv. glycinea]
MRVHFASIQTMLQNFLNEFGYFALFLGTFFEGETILVLAGFLAFRGYMDLNIVILVAFCGSYAGDQLWYFMGRKHGRKLLARKPRWQLMGDKALRLVRKHPDIWVLSFRFVYGLRTVMPVAIG